MKFVVLTGENTSLLESVMLDTLGSYFCAFWAEMKNENNRPRSEQEQVDFIDTLLKLTNQDGIVFATHSIIAFNAIRVAVCEGKINCKDVEIRFYNSDETESYRVLELNLDGRLLEWPSSFFGVGDQQLITLLSYTPGPNERKF